MKSIRSISPFISLVLMILILSGSFGFTLIHHTCQQCGADDIIATVAGTPDEDSCCCINETDEIYHHHSPGETVVTDDCCSHEAERIVTGELIRSEVQVEIMPYLLAATIIAVIQDHSHDTARLHFNDNHLSHGRDLTTLHCQILS